MTMEEGLSEKRDWQELEGQGLWGKYGLYIIYMKYNKPFIMYNYTLIL